MDEMVDEDMNAVDTVESSQLRNIGVESSVKSEYHGILQSKEFIIPPYASRILTEGSDKGLDGEFDSLVELGQISHKPDSPGDGDVMVEELTVRNIGAASLSLVSTSGGAQRIQSGQGNLLLGGSGNDRTYGFPNSKSVLFCSEGNVVKSSMETKGGISKSTSQLDNQLKIRGVDDKFCHSVGGTVSEALPSEDTCTSIRTSGSGAQRIQSGQGNLLLGGSGSDRTFGFPNSKNVLFYSEGNIVKSSMETKGGISKSTSQLESQLKIRGVDDKFCSSVGGTVSKALPSKGTPTSIRTSGSDSYVFAEGVNLREWLKSRGEKVERAGCMYILKQILVYVNACHSQGLALQNLYPSCFKLLFSNHVRYLGCCMEMLVNQDIPQKQDHLLKKRHAERDVHPLSGLCFKKPRYSMDSKATGLQGHMSFTPDVKVENEFRKGTSSSSDHFSNVEKQSVISLSSRLELMCYASPEQTTGCGCTVSSNVYQMGVLLFELLNSFESEKLHATAMLNLRHRILPPRFLSEYPREAGFCLWLLHPEPSSRPTTREILQSGVFDEVHIACEEEHSSSLNQDYTDSELLIHFLHSVEAHKQKHASKLIKEIECIESDIKEVQKRHFSRIPNMEENCTLREQRSSPESLPLHSPLTRSLKNMQQLENAYFSTRSEIQLHCETSTRADNDILRSRERVDDRGEGEDHLGAFFHGLCKYARYSKLEARAILRNGDLMNSANVICSLSFDRDEEFFSTAGVSKKIKIFDFHSLITRDVDVHYPLAEMVNKSKLSCVCWNSYIKNYLASSDYDGIVKIWDASTGVGVSQYNEHHRRAWSVDFSRTDPTKLASGSDDCSVKLWSINERKCLGTIKNIANVCCVQFSPHSAHLVSFGSADYKTYCYDLRNTRIPWCVLAGHSKTVSYTKFLDSSTLVSASTDNTLKIWDLNRTTSAGLSTNACSLTLTGHTNEKNFVGLSVSDGYIACGSETNEVYTYHRSMPMPITSHKFSSIDPISGNEVDDFSGQFVSSVCWQGKSDMIVAANSVGCIKVLRVV